MHKWMNWINSAIHYRSARSLAGSATPPSITYMRAAKSGPSAMEFIQHSSSDDDDDEASPPTSQMSAPRPIPRSFDVSLVFFVGLDEMSNKYHKNGDMWA